MDALTWVLVIAAALLLARLAPYILVAVVGGALVCYDKASYWLARRRGEVRVVNGGEDG